MDVYRTSGMFSALKPGKLVSYLWQSRGQPRNPSGVLRLHALNTPDRIALVDPRSGRRLSYAQLDERANRLATALAARGAGPGARVALMMRNCAEYLEIQWAATNNVPHYYLGYWVRGCRSMGYKASFHPHQLVGSDGVWRDESKIAQRRPRP